jgi:hypothetical protein
VGLKIDKGAAVARFSEALELARSNSTLPANWLEHTTRLHSASKSFTPMLGTALLAKSVNHQVDAFALQASASHKGYSARSLAKDVLVVQSVLAGIDLRTEGAEPLNNSPFFREKKVGMHLGVSPRDRPDLSALCDALADADFLGEGDALDALAAFLRVRIALGEAPAHVPVGDKVMSLLDLGAHAEAFIDKNREGGRRGQAFVAACLDLVHESVLAGRINDPSVRVPGDVLVLDGTKQTTILSVEAKQKPVSAGEVLQFANRLAGVSVSRGIYCAFDPHQPSLDTQMLETRAFQNNGVLLKIFMAPAELLEAAALWSTRPLDECLKVFPGTMAKRLEEFGCSEEGGTDWAVPFG